MTECKELLCCVQRQEAPLAEGADDEAELEALRARLANVRS